MLSLVKRASDRMVLFYMFGTLVFLRYIICFPEPTNSGKKSMRRQNGLFVYLLQQFIYGLVKIIK